MAKPIITLVAAALTLIPATGLAQRVDTSQFIDGNNLLDYCINERRSAAWFAAGVADTARVFQSAQILAPAVCIAEGVILPQVTDVACQYLEKHPEKRLETAAGLVMNALTEAFPCTD